MNSSDIKVGAKFGRWTVLEINTVNPNSKAKRPPRMAFCQCECGKTRYKEYRDLYSGRSLSCGCLRREQVIQRNYEKGTIPIGTKFGLLTVIEDLGYKKQNCRDKQVRYSLCKCDCGNIVEVLNNNLKTGGSQSCGCVQSRGEQVIAKILRDNNINFCTQYSFPDLKTEKNGTLRFDFAIFKNNTLYSLIEFDGRQHYFGPEASWSHCNSLEEIQYRDNLKNEYCKKNNIHLIRIPYYEINEITLERLGLQNEKK